MPILATVEVGVLRPVLAAEQSYTMIKAPRSKRYPGAVHFAVKIGDDCMDAREGAPSLSPGMTALCLDMAPAGLIVESQHLYCVRRTSDAGRTWETLVRRAEVYRDRTILYADTSNVAHSSEIVVARALPVVQALPWKNVNQPAICVFGLVYGAMFGFE